MVYFLIYTSTPRVEITREILNDIAMVSIKNNFKKGITGILLGMENKFMQYLEGDEQEVLALFETLKKDERHKDVTRWLSGHTQERVFSKWSMASWMVSPEELEKLSALKDLKHFLRNNEADIEPRRFIALMNGLLKTWIEKEEV